MVPESALFWMLSVRIRERLEICEGMGPRRLLLERSRRSRRRRVEISGGIWPEMSLFER